MSWTNVKLIFVREVRDQLRDRRTLFMIAVLPLFLYPALGVGMVNLLLQFQEQPRTVVILGGEQLPTEPPLLDGRHFQTRWFYDEDDQRLTATDTTAEKLDVVLDSAAPPDEGKLSPDPTRSTASRRAEILANARKIAERLAVREPIAQRLRDAEKANDEPKIETIRREIKPLNEEISRMMADHGIHVLLVIPEGFKDEIATATERRTSDNVAAAERRLPIYHNSADERSKLAEARVAGVLRRWEREILRQRLSDTGLPKDWTTPVNPSPDDLAEKEQVSASVWSKLFPALLIIWAVTGAFYPAIDLGAGEKERGTMETLLICPASRLEIVLGKFFTVMMFSAATAALNLLSMGATSKYLASLVSAGTTLRGFGELQPPSPASIAWVFVLLVPLSALFSALCLSLATFARSTKEGQYYLTPLLMVVLGMTVFCLSPGIEMTPFYSVTPVVGVALLLKQVLAAPTNPESFLYVAPVLLTSVIYAGLALWWAIEQFQREEVLFREAERFDLRLWFRHLMRDKEATPSFAEAVLCFVMIMLLQFAAMKFQQDRLRSTTPATRDTVMLQLLMVQQLVIIATPALLMGAMLTTDFRKTFSLFLPEGKMMAVAAALGLFLHPLSHEMMSRLAWFFPPLPDSAKAALTAMGDGRQPVWVVLLAIAVLPGVCEELAFRGFILSGFRRSGRPFLGIALSALLFGLMHMIAQQVFNAVLLGIVIGLICVRSKSILPGIVFHILYNSVQVLLTRVDPATLRTTPATWFIQLVPRGDAETVQYTWLTLGVCGTIVALLLRWLFVVGRREDALLREEAGLPASAWESIGSRTAPYRP